MRKYLILPLITLLFFTFFKTTFSKCSDFNSCGRRGYCFKGSCVCFQGSKGNNCEQKECPSTCQNCVWETKRHGFFGLLELSYCKCPRDCGGRGKCDTNTGRCTCDRSYSGSDCTISNNCNKCVNGICAGRYCICNSGWVGTSCETVKPSYTRTPRSCNGGVSTISVSGYSRCIY